LSATAFTSGLHRTCVVTALGTGYIDKDRRTPGGHGVRLHTSGKIESGGLRNHFSGRQEAYKGYQIEE
jgi:hypothetical protein